MIITNIHELILVQNCDLECHIYVLLQECQILNWEYEVYSINCIYFI
jgi:hypothetical protein